MDKRKQWVALTALAVLAVFAGGWVLLVSPKRAEAAGVREQVAQQTSANAQLRTKIAMLKVQAQRLPEQEAKIAAVKVKIPEAAGQPELLRTLAAAAKGSGVDLISLTPGAATPVTGAAEPFVELPLTIVAHGGYSGLQRYAAALEGLDRAVRVTGLEIVPSESPVAPKAADAAQIAPQAATSTVLVDGQHLLATIHVSVYTAAGAPPPVPVAAAAATPGTAAVAPPAS